MVMYRKNICNELNLVGFCEVIMIYLVEIIF